VMFGFRGLLDRGDPPLLALPLGYYPFVLVNDLTQWPGRPGRPPRAPPPAARDVSG